MPDQPPPFVVVDKRKFTPEGTIREGFVPPEPEVRAPPPVPAAEEPSGAKVVTMPARELQPADDLAEESLGGSVNPLGAGLDVDGDGLETEADLPGGALFDEGAEEAIGEPRSAEETAAQESAYRQSSNELDAMLRQANPGMEATGPVGFEHLIQSFYLSAIMAMGAGAEPGQKPRIDILGARQSIDMLTVLADKTRGNLSPDEQQLLQGITFELRMMFLELTNAISRQAHQPAGSVTPPGGQR